MRACYARGLTRPLVTPLVTPLLSYPLVTPIVIPLMKSSSRYRKISNELNISVDQCKQSFNMAFSRFKGSPSENTKLSKLLEQAGPSLDFEYCFDNFSNLCRFCCKLQEGDSAFQTIFDDSTEELLSRSSELIEKIHFTLYENVSQC